MIACRVVVIKWVAQYTHLTRYITFETKMFIIIDYTLVWICRSLIIAAYNRVWQHLLMFFMSLGIPETARTVEAERAQDLAG